MSITQDYLDGMKTVLENATWTSLTPKTVILGPLPPLIEYPAIAVMAAPGVSERETLARVNMVETVSWTVVRPVEMDNAASNYQTMLDMRDEMFDLITANNDWGVSDVQYTSLTGWDTDVFRIGDNAPLLQHLTIELEVKYFVYDV